MQTHRLALGLVALSLAACASGPPVAYVTTSYTSSPSGALVVRDGVTLGRTPLTLVAREPLAISQSDGSITSTCHADAVTFSWPSGARTTVSDPCQASSADASRIEPVPGSKTQYTASMQVSASRPPDAPNAKRDVSNATGLGMFASIPFPAPRTYPFDSQLIGLISVYGGQYRNYGYGYSYYSTTSRH